MNRPETVSEWRQQVESWEWMKVHTPTTYREAVLVAETGGRPFRAYLDGAR